MPEGAHGSPPKSCPKWYETIAMSSAKRLILAKATVVQYKGTCVSGSAANANNTPT